MHSNDEQRKEEPKMNATHTHTMTLRKRCEYQWIRIQAWYYSNFGWDYTGYGWQFFDWFVCPKACVFEPSILTERYNTNKTFNLGIAYLVRRNFDWN